MKRFLLGLVLLLALCVKSPAPTVNFASPPFDITQFIVNQPGNFLGIRYPGITNINYIPGTTAYVSNQQAYLGTNNFSGGGGGGIGTLTNGLYTNAGPADTYVLGSTLFLKTNTFGGSGSSGITQLTGDGTAGPGSGSQALTLATVMASPGTYRSLTVNGKGLATAGSNPTTVAGYGLSDTWANMAAALSGTVPTASLGGGTANGLTFLNGSQNWELVVTNVVATNAGPPVLVLNDIAYINTNAFGGGGGGITALTKDVTASGSGSVAATVVGLNGTLLSSLQSGVMLNTFSTGVPSTVSSWPSLAAQLSSLIPQSALGTGSGGAGTKVLYDDQTYKTVSASGITSLSGTNAQVPSVIGSVGYTPTGFISNSTFNLQSVQKAFTFGGFQNTNWFLSSGFGSGQASGVAADLNGDGLIDFVGPRAATGVEVFTNGGYPNAFNMDQSGAAAAIITAVGTPTCIVIGDVNGDGRPDIIIQSASAVQVFTNSGTATFAQLGTNYTISGGTGVYAEDYNGDGSIDFISSSSSTAAAEYTNNGIGIFVTNSAAVFPSFAKTAFIGATAHFMGTANWDLALDIPGPNILLLTNNGVGIFFAISTNAGTITANGELGVGDFNNDGRPDLMDNVGTSSRFYVFTNNGAGVLGLYSTLIVPVSGVNYAPAAADFNMDGWQDLLVPNSTGGYVIYTNSLPAGLSAFTSFSTNLPAASSLNPFVGDFNNDGRPDIAWMGTVGALFLHGVQWDDPWYYGVFQGDASRLENGQVSVVYSSSIVTPANAWVPSVQSVNNFGTLTLGTNYVPLNAIMLHVVTANGIDLTNVLHVTVSAATSGTVTADNTHQSETTYLNSGSTITTITLALPTTTIVGRTWFLHPKSAITTLAVTGGAFVDAAVTSMTAGQTIGYQAVDTAGTYIRMQ